MEEHDGGDDTEEQTENYHDDNIKFKQNSSHELKSACIFFQNARFQVFRNQTGHLILPRKMVKQGKIPKIWSFSSFLAPDLDQENWHIASIHKCLPLTVFPRVDKKKDNNNNSKLYFLHCRRSYRSQLLLLFQSLCAFFTSLCVREQNIQMFPKGTERFFEAPSVTMPPKNLRRSKTINNWFKKWFLLFC